ncbi:hypothetical protein TFLX_02850 [Thermoflexales bacterium]|nr:hypothetical protein TFLX_02850 [Thermoflexales bacterium]
MKYRFGAVILLLIMLWLETSTLSITAATPDEPMHILRGYVFVQRGLALVTYWRAGDQVVKPMQLFAHAIGPDGTIVAQADRLDVPAFGWRTGDLIAQVNQLQFVEPPAPELADLLAGIPVVAIGHTLIEHPAYQLYHFSLSQRVLEAAQHSTQVIQNATLPVTFEASVELLGYDLRPDSDRLTLLTYWHAGHHSAAPLQMFVHVLRPDGSIGMQVDRLDASAADWPPDDLIVQIHYIDLPSNFNKGAVAIGLYHPDTGTRLPVILNDRTVDRLLLPLPDLK